MKITSITIILRQYRSDFIALHTDLPSPFPILAPEESLFLSSEAARGTGEEYVRKHFPNIPVDTEYGPNVTEIQQNNGDSILFSYETPVAGHISAWLGGNQASVKPQLFFEELSISHRVK